MKNKGFTLIELAIVLVIAALIIAVILQGQQMVANSKLNAVVKEVNEIKTAFNNFKLKYDALPGDMINAADIWSTATNGDGDGKIDKTVGGIGESLQVWYHLSISQTFSGNFTGALSSSKLIPETNIPPTEFSKIGGYTYYDRASGTTYSVYTKTGNVLEFGACDNSQAAFIYCSNGIMTGAKAESIDKKMDDGDASTGEVMGTDGYSDVATRVTGCADDYTASSASYTVNSDTEACRLFFWLEEPEN